MIGGNDKILTPPGRFAATLPIEGRETAPKSAHALKTEALAKALRRRLTGPEMKLWAHLKRIQTVDTHFRKQTPFGRYILDFACHRAKLVIEIDGDQHGWARQALRDDARDRMLISEGYHVLRFSNRDVLQEIEAVLDTIYAALHGAETRRSHSKRRTSKVETPSSPSMGEVAHRAGGGDMTGEGTQS